MTCSRMIWWPVPRTSSGPGRSSCPPRRPWRNLSLLSPRGVQDEVYTRILTGLTPELLRAMDDLLEVPSGERHSLLFQLKEYPPEASPAVILRYMARYHFLRDLGVGAIDLRRVSLPMIRYFAEVAKRYDVRALRRFSPGQTLCPHRVFPGGSP